MRYNLAAKFVLIVSVIVVVVFLNGLTAIVFTRSVVRSFDSAISENLPSIKAAEELQIALLEQKGLISAYILAGGDSSWLERLRNAEATFGTSLARARASAHTPEERIILEKLEPVIAEHKAKCEKVALQMGSGQRNEAVSVLLHEVWPAFDKAYQLSEEFIGANDRYVGMATKRGEQSVAWAMWGIAVWSLCTVGFSTMLLWLLFRRVIIPLRQMASDARDFMGGHSAATVDSIDDELRSIGVYFQTLMSEMADTRMVLTETRKRMLNAEKLAAVGKLAASVAHEMRNPLSSMKMWLHSLRKSAGADPAMERKFQILSDEIGRLERIVRNVLEFSRPPIPNLKPHSIVDVIDGVLEIAGPTLDAGNIQVVQCHASGLPQVLADSEQLKQVFINLLGNAAEAMPGGGEISISSVVETDRYGASTVVVRIRDTGPGIPDEVRSRLFEPFFTTKDEGTGLGLCIAANIMARQGGQLVLETSTPRGAAFAVRVPLASEKKMSNILVVDDEPTMLAAFEELLGNAEHEVATARRAEEAIEKLQGALFDLVILDVRLPGMSGLEVLRQIKIRHPKVPVIVMTGHGTMNTAVEATKLGAFDYQLKPIEPEQILATIERALAGVRLMRGQVVFGSESAAAGGDAIVGRSAPMQEVYKAIGRVAQTEAGVLIRGESGTGKELVARAIYQHSLRADKPLTVINCAAIPETLLESELFGHERGAFTGASGERIGKFQQASDGTIFLDEIGDIPLGIQAKILRVLQDKSFQRLGGNKTIRSNARVLAATNRNLEKAIAEGHFREDLFYRLNIFTITLPPLRERAEDIPDLVDYSLRRFANELKIDAPLLSEDAMEALRTYSWPGNVRELEHCIQRVMISTGGHPIQAADLSLFLSHTDRRAAYGLPTADDSILRDLVRRYLDSSTVDLPHERLLQRVEALLIAEALQRTKGNQTHAARLLGLPRQTLCDKLQKYRISMESSPLMD